MKHTIINKDIVLLLMCITHLVVFISIILFTNIKNVAFIAEISIIVWGTCLLLSKNIKQLNDWYNKPFNIKK